MNHTRIAILSGLFSVAVMAEDPPAATPIPEQIEFKFKFEPGRVQHQHVVSTSVGSMSMPFPGPLSDMKFSQVFEQTLSSVCRKVNEDKSAVFDMTLADLGMKMSMGGFKIEYDSRTFDPQTADEATAMVGRMFQIMNGSTFTVTVSESGRPIKVEGLAESLKKAAAKLAADPQGAVFSEVINQFGSFLSDDTMNEQMQSFYRMSPSQEGPLKIGAKWNQTWSMKMPLVGGDFEGRGDYQLVGLEEVNGRRCAKIRTRESFKMVPKPGLAAAAAKDSAIAQMLAGMQMDLSTSGGDGYAYIDYQRGELVKLRQTQNMTMTMKMPAPEAPKNEKGETVEMPPFTMKLRNTVSVDVVDGPAASSSPAAAKSVHKRINPAARPGDKTPTKADATAK